MLIAYREYLRSLRDYLVGFLKRTQPLQDTAAQLAKGDEQFEVNTSTLWPPWITRSPITLPPNVSRWPCESWIILMGQQTCRRG